MTTLERHDQFHRICLGFEFGLDLHRDQNWRRVTLYGLPRSLMAVQSRAAEAYFHQELRRCLFGQYASQVIYEYCQAGGYDVSDLALGLTRAINDCRIKVYRVEQSGRVIGHYRYEVEEQSSILYPAAQQAAKKPTMAFRRCMRDAAQDAVARIEALENDGFENQHRPLLNLGWPIPIGNRTIAQQIATSLEVVNSSSLDIAWFV